MIFKELGIKSTHYQHGFKRGVYFAMMYDNGNEFLQNKIDESQLKMKKKFTEGDEYTMKWWKPKAIRRYAKLFDEGRIKPEPLFYLDIIGMTWEKAKRNIFKRSRKMSNSLWVEKYRPDTLEGYVGNEHILEKVKIYIENEDVPHLLLYGVAGTGKTTLAKIITNQIDCDLMYINASDENSVDAVRDKIRGFASSMGFRKWKVIILDESDYLTPNAQAALRNLMETFSATTRFILTCNYVEKIIDPIQSRCQTFAI